MDVSFEGAGDLRRLVVDLGKASRQVFTDAEAALEKGAERVRDALEGQAAASRHFNGVAGSVTFERRAALGGVSFDVGPERGRGGGSLGHIFWLGGANGGGGTGDLDGAVREERSALESAMGDIFRSVL